MDPATTKPWRRRGTIAALGGLLLLLLLAASVSATEGDSAERALWGQRQQKKAAVMPTGGLKPVRPRRPKVPNNSTSGGGQQNGPVPGAPVVSQTGTVSPPVDQLPDELKPDGKPRDPRYRATKRAFKPTVGSGPGTPDPVLQDEMLIMNFDGTMGPPSASSQAEAEATEEAEQARYAALVEALEAGEGVGALEDYGDDRRQRRRLAPIMGQNFAGINYAQSGYSSPPDTNGAVGPNHYVQMVNSLYAVYSKTGQVLVSPRNINTLFANSGLSACINRNDGDPIVLYDRWADRWILSQFTATSPYGQCVAVSTTGNPTGSYYRFFFSLSTTVFYDYPKMGIWRDTYIFTFNMFDPNYYTGASVLAINRQDMLNGVASPRVREFKTTTSYYSLLPADVDSAELPPSTGPQGVLISSGSYLYFWKLNIDWANPSAATMTGPQTVSPAAYSQACPGSSSCIPQQGTNMLLDALGDRLLFRFAYRKFPTYDSAVVVQSVNALTSGTKAGIRWYEIRNVATGTPYIYQQGTYSPDEKQRWMGSIAQDKAGNIAMGYSLSSTAMYVAIAITGRLSTDALGVMTQGETVVQTGAGAQTQVDRWGDYSSISIDPVDDCTFWFTTEYIASTGWSFWNTRIVSFKLPNCASIPTPAPTATPAPSQVPAGPTPSPTRAPTKQPTPLRTGTCGSPYPITLGDNAFNNAPATGLTLTTPGTCSFSSTDQNLYNAVYYRFTPIVTASYVFSTCDTADFDTKIVVATACDPTQGFITCNDDDPNCTGFTSTTPPAVLTAGIPYYVIVGGYSRSTTVGSGIISVTGTFPTQAPTKSPTVPPPTRQPTTAPTRLPTTGATPSPTRAPSRSPTRAPTRQPTTVPVPTRAPTRLPTKRPTSRPTRAPTRRPTFT